MEEIVEIEEQEKVGLIEFQVYLDDELIDAVLAPSTHSPSMVKRTLINEGYMREIEVKL